MWPGCCHEISAYEEVVVTLNHLSKEQTQINITAGNGFSHDTIGYYYVTVEVQSELLH